MGPHAGGHMFSSIPGGMGPCHVCPQTPVYKFSVAGGMGPFAVAIHVTKCLINVFSSISAGMGPQTDGCICFLAPDQ